MDANCELCKDYGFCACPTMSPRNKLNKPLKEMSFKETRKLLGGEVYIFKNTKAKAGEDDITTWLIGKRKSDSPLWNGLWLYFWNPISEYWQSHSLITMSGKVKDLMENPDNEPVNKNSVYYRQLKKEWRNG